MKHTQINRFVPCTMDEFLENYVNEMLEEENKMSAAILMQLKQNKATHKDISEIGIPYCIRIPYDEVIDEDVLSGNVLLVADFRSTRKHMRIAPYIRPSLVKEQSIGISKEKRRKYND